MICLHFAKKKYIQYDKITLYKCGQCGLIYSQKKETKFNPKDLYNNYYKNEIGAGKFNFLVEYVVKIFRLFRAFKIYTLMPKAKSILDIGCGRGFMLYFLKKYFGYKTAVGTQLDKKALGFARNKLGLIVYDKDLLKLRLKEGSFDVITIWHVLEHVKSPERYLQQIYRLLKKGGKLIIEVPNFDSWTRILTGKYWLSLDPKYHLYFFTPLVLTQMLEKLPFKIQAIHTFSLEYSVFTSVQSLASRLTKTDQLFFKWLQNSNFSYKIIFHLLLFIILTPICFLANLFLFFSKKGEVLLVVAEKK